MPVKSIAPRTIDVGTPPASLTPSQAYAGGRSAPELFEIVKGEVRLHMHKGQRRVWQSGRRILLMLAGTQSGKTSFGPHWLYREIQRCRQGDYLVVAPTFPLLDLKAIPATTVPEAERSGRARVTFASDFGKAAAEPCIQGLIYGSYVV